MPRVLLVDDDESLRTMLHDFLERWGFQVELAALLPAEILPAK